MHGANMKTESLLWNPFHGCQ